MTIKIDQNGTLDPANTANILHLSDLHFGADKLSEPLSDASRWCGQLIDDLCEEQLCEQLDAVIVSGDIGNFSEPSEYEAAQSFFNCLCKKFGLTASNIIIVPGNHDLNWKDSKKGYRLVDEEDHDEPLKDGHFIRVSEDVIRLRDDDVFPTRFKHFSEFYKNIFGIPYPLDPGKQATLHHLPKLNLLVVGLN